jgi:hypothetical protein
MPTPTYTPLATVTLGSSASSVTFSSIPATYRDLILIVRRTTTTAANIVWRVNNDSGNNYNRVIMLGSTSAGVASASNSNVSSLFLDNGASDTTIPVLHIVQFMDYSATDKHKTVLTRETTTDASTSAIASRWASTPAITSISMAASTGSLAIGSTFNLYGISA